MVFLLAVAGCTPIRSEDQPLIEASDDGFSLRLSADILHPPMSDGAEAERRALIVHEVVARGLCPAGYRIVARDFEPHGDRYLGIQVGTIRYVGKCNPRAW